MKGYTKIMTTYYMYVHNLKSNSNVLSIIIVHKHLILYYDLSNLTFFDLYFNICLCGLFVPIFV